MQADGDGDGALRSVAGSAAGSAALSASMDAEAGSGGSSSEAGHGDEGGEHGDFKCCIPNVLQVSLFTVTFCANSANDLTCPPHIL